MPVILNAGQSVSFTVAAVDASGNPEPPWIYRRTKGRETLGYFFPSPPTFQDVLFSYGRQFCETGAGGRKPRKGQLFHVVPQCPQVGRPSTGKDPAYFGA
jgi:hypothetical protein